MALELLYFDHDHGLERLLAIRMDREAHAVHFRFDRAADPTYDDGEEDEDSGEEPVTVNATTDCGSAAQFDGFCRALVTAMRSTPFSLQDPSKRPFARMDHTSLLLEGFGDGVPPQELTCQIPAEIVEGLRGLRNVPELLRSALVG